MFPTDDIKRKKIPSFEEVMQEDKKTTPKVPSFEEVMGEPAKKKVSSIDFSESSLEAGNSLSPSGLSGEVGAEIVPFDPIGTSLNAKTLSNKTKEISMPSSGKGGQLLTTVPDEESKKEAALQFKQVAESGYDPHKLARDFDGIDYLPHKEELLEDYKTNPQVYERKLARIKWDKELDNSLKAYVVSGYIDPDDYEEIRGAIESSLRNSSVGDYKQQRENVNSVSTTIKQFGGEKSDEILKNYATEVSKVYGNSYKNGFDKIIEGSPESKYLTPEAQLGYQYIKDLSPEQAKQYERLLIDPKTIKDNPAALRGYNSYMMRLEETGIGLQKNSVKEDLNNLQKINDKNGGLTEEQWAEAKVLTDKQNELELKEKELDAKYPDRITDKVDDAKQEIFGQKANMPGRFQGLITQGVGHTVDGIWNFVSQPFRSDASQNLIELGIMGQTIKEEKDTHLTDKNKAIQDSELIIEPDLKAKIDAIVNDSNLSDQQKESIVTQYLENNLDKFGRVPIQGGRFNPSVSSILTAVTDLTATLVPFIAVEAATGGIGGAGAIPKFFRTANAAFTTGFYDHISEGISQGKTGSELYKYGVVTTLIDAMAIAGAGTASEVRAMAGNKTSGAKMLATLSDKEIEQQLSKGLPKSLKVFGKDVKPYIQAAKDRAVATPKMFLQGLKTGGKFEGAMAAANEAKHQIYDTEIDRETNLKHSILGGLSFGIMGAGLGHIGYKPPHELQKDFIIQVGKSPESFRELNIQMKKDGEVTSTEFDHRNLIIDKSEEAFKTLPKANAKGQPLTEKEKGDYLYQTVIKNEATKAKSDLPPKQAAEAERTALVADHTRGLILEPPTDKQLEDRKGVLERKLEPKKDAEGKSIELPEKEKLDMQAELKAIDNTIEQRKNNVTVEPPKEVAETIELKEPSAEVIETEVNPVKVELPREIPEPIKLKDEKTEVTEDIKPTEKEGVADIGVTETTPEAKAGETGEIKGITQAANEVRRQETALPEYERNSESFPEWNNEAEKLLKNGYDVEGLMNKIEKGHDPNPVENAIRKIYYATIDVEVAKNPTDKLLAIQKRNAQVGDLANSRAGRNLVSLKGEGSPLSSISDFYVAKMDAKGVEKLTDAEKAEVKKQYEDVQKTSEDANLKIQKLQEENAKLKAEAKIREEAKTTKKQTKDFKAEREDIKKSILDKWNKAKNVGISADPSKDLLMDIAPDVAKLVKSYIQEGVVKLEEVVNKIHEELKGYIPNITEKHITDIISGQYNAPKETKGDLLAKLKSIKNKKSEEAIKILAKIKSGDFAKEEKNVSWVENTELQKKYPKEFNAALDAIKAKEDARHEFDIALLRDQMARRTLGEKATDALSKTAGTIKAITTGIDDSAVAIQTYVSMLVRPRTGVKAFYQHIRQGLSQKKFDRWLSKLHTSPDYKEMREMGLDVTEPSSLKEREKEEIFNNRFSGTIKIKGKEYKILDAPLKPFERAFTTLGNVTRVVGYRTISQKYKREGYTPEKDPELFKSLAKRLNTETGRGQVNEYVDMANKVVTMGIWSPKLMAQKFNILGISDLASLVLSKAGTKGYYRQLHPKERIAAIKDVAQFATTVMALSYGFALAFGGDVDDDPLSSTFMDIKLPNGKSYNFTGGFSSYIRSIAQFAAGQKRKDGKAKDVGRLETAGRFFRGKTPPLTSATLNLAAGKNFMGQETTAGEELVNLAPISLKGIVNQIQNDGAESLFTQGIPTFFGFNVKNEKDYEKPPEKKPQKPKKKEKPKKPN